jgi:hypothetical protein
MFRQWFDDRVEESRLAKRAIEKIKQRVSAQEYTISGHANEDE